MHPRSSFGKTAYRWPSFQAWKQDRARQARERAARWREKNKLPPRPITLKARAIMFLTEIIVQPNQMLMAVDVMRRAVGMRLQRKGATKPSKALRDARAALGITTEKIGLNDGWGWYPPKPKSPDISDGAQSAYARMKKTRQAFDPAEGALPRSHTVEVAAAVSKNAPPNSRRGSVAWQAHRIEQPPSPATDTNPAAAKKVELVDTATGNPCFWRIGDAVGIYPISTGYRPDDDHDSEDFWRLMVVGSDDPPPMSRAEIIAAARVDRHHDGASP